MTRRFPILRVVVTFGSIGYLMWLEYFYRMSWFPYMSETLIADQSIAYTVYARTIAELILLFILGFYLLIKSYRGMRYANFLFAMGILLSGGSILPLYYVISFPFTLKVAHVFFG